jgi:hypothetical protein
MEWMLAVTCSRNGAGEVPGCGTLRPLLSLRPAPLGRKEGLVGPQEKAGCCVLGLPWGSRMGLWTYTGSSHSILCDSWALQPKK